MICFTGKHGLWLWMSFLLLYYAAADHDHQQNGSISVDCGASSNSTDLHTGIKWTTDASFITTGINHILQSVDPTTAEEFIINQPQLKTLRSFPADRSKHCYTLSASKDSSYLLRATFFHGGFQTEVDNEFSYSIDSTVVERLRWIQELVAEVRTREYMIVAKSNLINFCLIPKVGVAFISTLELRPLAAGMYDVVFQGRYLKRLSRVNCGGIRESPIRFPNDPYDRIWYSPGDGNLTSVTPTTAQIIVPDGVVDIPPMLVMQSAWVSSGAFSWNLSISDYEFEFTPTFYTNHFFAEIDNVGPTDTRSVDIDLNGRTFLHNVTVASQATQENTRAQILTSGENKFRFSANVDSNLGPLINAFEIYASRDVNQSITDVTDVLAVEEVKSSLGLSSWTGDPCLPVPYNWLTCNEGTNLRVTKMNLSQYNLDGTIPARIAELTALTELLLDDNNITGGIPNLSDLTKLTTLHLQNNSLSGGIPSTLATLPLTELFLSDNKLSGPIPSALANRQARGLNLTTSGNVHLCNATENCPVLPVDLPDGGGGGAGLNAVVIGFFVSGAVLLVAIGILVWLYCRKRSKPIPSPESIRDVYYDHEQDAASVVEEPNASSSRSVGGAAAANQARAFSLAEVREATQSYKLKIGQGGFGPVYYGKLPDGSELAVKVKSATSSQGTTQFFNEVSLLSRVHHENLVSLLGYCEENGRQSVIYEYMAKGTLTEHLYGKDRKGQISWKERLEIALNAAEGLGYLHNHCFPKIIHRDIKSNNILLNDKLLAKVADFGISKLAPEDNQSCGVSTKVIGTPGYLDPEYHKQNKLTQKSDVYSFGVVLFEIISGRPPISPEAGECINLVEWAQRKVRTNDIVSLVDPAIAGKYSVVAMWKVAELAMRCVESASVDRPDMKQVVRGLTEALEYEEARKELQGYETQAGMGVERGYGSTTFSRSSSSQSTRDYDQGSVKSVPRYPGLSPSASLLLFSDTRSFGSLHSDIGDSGASRLAPR